METLVCHQIIHEDGQYFILQIGNSKIVLDEQTAKDLYYSIEDFLCNVEEFFENEPEEC